MPRACSRFARKRYDVRKSNYGTWGIPMSKKSVKIPVQTSEQKRHDDPQAEKIPEESMAADARKEEGTVEAQRPREEQEGEASAQAEVVDTDELLEEMKQLREELEQARAEAAEYKDRWLRTVAEMDNMRKRLERRFADEAEREKRRFLRTILPLVDNLEMVLKHSDSDPEVLRQGVELIHQELLRTLESEGLKPIESVGQRFDPFVHEAVEVVETDEHPADTIVDEVQRGYMYKGELLRPARVRVAKGDTKERKEAGA